ISAGAIVVAVLACQAAVPAAPPFASCATAQLMPITIIAKPRILFGAESFCQLFIAHLTSAEFPSGNRSLLSNASGKVFGPPPSCVPGFFHSAQWRQGRQHFLARNRPSALLPSLRGPSH